VAVLLVSVPLAMVQGAQPGPLKFTMALAGSKPVPVMENENVCPLTGGFGVVARAVTCGAVPVELATVSDTPFEAVPVDPFCTVTVKVPAPNVAGPANCVAVLLVSAVLAMLHGEQPGPVIVVRTVFGSNPVPVIVNVNACPLVGDVGTVATVVICGAVPVEFATVSDTPFEDAPADPL
jgi:hypothetical protein